MWLHAIICSQAKTDAERFKSAINKFSLTSRTSIKIGAEQMPTSASKVVQLNFKNPGTNGLLTDPYPGLFQYQFVNN
jgi:hypothetical protein